MQEVQRAEERDIPAEDTLTAQCGAEDRLYGAAMCWRAAWLSERTVRGIG